MLKDWPPYLHAWMRNFYSVRMANVNYGDSMETHSCDVVCIFMTLSIESRIWREEISKTLRFTFAPKNWQLSKLLKNFKNDISLHVRPVCSPEFKVMISWPRVTCIHTNLVAMQNWVCVSSWSFVETTPWSSIDNLNHRGVAPTTKPPSLEHFKSGNLPKNFKKQVW